MLANAGPAGGCHDQRLQRLTTGFIDVAPSDIYFRFLANAFFQEEDFLEGLCPWIPDDDKNRVEQIFNIFKEGASDPFAFTFNSGYARIEGNLSKLCFFTSVNLLYCFGQCLQYTGQT